jgi:hypothetical protein
MTSILVDDLRLRFPDAWQVAKYDDWVFYRRRFQSMVGGAKAMDVLAVQPNRTVWLIEVKDYRQQNRTNPSSLAEDVARKVFDTLAALLPAAIHADEDSERTLARVVTGASSLRVVLHLEQPRKHSKLFPRAIRPADVQQEMRRLIKPIDAHPMVCESSNMRGLDWSVQ